MKRKLAVILTKVATIIIGSYAIYVATLHGYYEILNKDRAPSGMLFDAISGNSLSTNFHGWPGWPAISIIPNFFITGIIVFVISTIMLLWLLLLFKNKHWEIVVIILAILLCLFGGGIIWLLLVIVAGTIGIYLSRIDHQKNI